MVYLRYGDIKFKWEVMKSEKIVFKNASGQELSARLDMPDSGIFTYALFSHCFTCGKDFTPVTRLVTKLSELGIATFRFDFTGIGSSEGDFADTNFTTNISDIISAAEYMKKNLSAPEIMIGHSWGGTASLAVAEKLPYVKSVVTIASPFDVKSVFNQIGKESLAEIREKGEAKVKLPSRPTRFKKQFIDDVEKYDITENIRNLEKALLVMHSPVDETVPIEQSRKIFETALHPKSFVSLDRADHLLMENPEDANYAARIIAAWVSKYDSTDLDD